MKITDLKPTAAWKFFHQVAQVPHPSKKEGKMIEFLESFAKEHKIAVKKDEVGNLLMSKPATPGMGDCPIVVLQFHMDVVCEKDNGTKHGFGNDPIGTIIDDEWLRTNDITLGTDNGVGVAAGLTLLVSDDIQHGPIECLFTVDKKTGLTGAKALKRGFITGDILLNLDSEGEGEIFMGCAGGRDTQATFHYEPVPTSDKIQYFRIDVKGLSSGHSGGEIHEGLGDTNKILVRFLFLLKKKYDFVLCSTGRRSLRNTVAHEVHAVTGPHPENKEDVRILLSHFAADAENELKHVDLSVRLAMEPTDRPEYCVSGTTAEKLTYALRACPHGAIGMNHDIEGLVEISTNLASMKMKESNTILIGTSQHSSTESCKIAIVNMIAPMFLLAKTDVGHGDDYPRWAPNPDSKILKIIQETYKRLLNKDAKIIAIHAGLECGLFLEKYPKLDMVSFGPILRDIYSPSEHIEIATVGLWWNHLLELLESILAE